MNENKFSFWSQNLKDVEHDFLHYDRKEIKSDEEREVLVNNFCITVESDNTASCINDKKLFVRYDEFAIEFIPKELDTAGREVPVLCMGILPKSCNDEWLEKLFKEIRFFLSESNRTVDDSAYKDFQELFEKYYLKRERKKQLVKIGGVLMVLAGATALYFLLESTGN